MIIIATTKDGFLIEATKNEVGEIIRAMLGTVPKDGNLVGQKIPAIDYAESIRKIRDLKGDYNFRQIFTALEDFNKEAAKFKKVIEDTANINLD